MRLDSGPASSAWELTEIWCRNSQHSKNCVSLSPHVEKLKVKKKVNKRFVPELKKVVSVSGFRMHMYIVHTHTRTHTHTHIYIYIYCNRTIFHRLLPSLVTSLLHHRKSSIRVSCCSDKMFYSHDQLYSTHIHIHAET